MLLMTPGPTPVPEAVRRAMGEETLHHRTPEFEAIFGNVRKGLLELMGTEEALMLASTGTGAMEAAVINLCRTKAITVNAGKFGERFGKIAKAFNRELVELKYDWNKTATVADVEKALADNPDADAFCIQVCESAGGLRHPVEEIAAKIKAVNPKVMVIADGITAVGVEAIDVTHIDALITGSQKALMLPPGLAMIGLSAAAVAKIEEVPAGYYFNLAAELKNQRKNTTAYTAATTLIIGLGAVLEKMENEGGKEALFADTAKRHAAGLAALAAIGLASFPEAPAKAMLSVEHDQADVIRKVLKTELELNVAGGQDHMKGRLFRINNMGFVKPYETAWALNGVELALDKLGLRPYDGAANRAFSAAYFKGDA